MLSITIIKPARTISNGGGFTFQLSRPQLAKALNKKEAVEITASLVLMLSVFCRRIPGYPLKPLPVAAIFFEAGSQLHRNSFELVRCIEIGPA